MFFYKTPALIIKLFPGILWRVETINKEIFLTFDDGPIPEVTPWVLDQLKVFGAKATFFMVGDNIIKHKDIYQQVIAHGHGIGNHTLNHLNGWQTDTKEYLDNITKSEQLVETKGAKLFRPPYGKLKWAQYQVLKLDYKIIMWDVLSGDFFKKIKQEDCLEKCVKNTSPGSVVVFHDSKKTFDKLKYVFPRYLEHFSELGYTFKSL